MAEDNLSSWNKKLLSMANVGSQSSAAVSVSQPKSSSNAKATESRSAKPVSSSVQQKRELSSASSASVSQSNADSSQVALKSMQAKRARMKSQENSMEKKYRARPMAQVRAEQRSKSKSSNTDVSARSSQPSNDAIVRHDKTQLQEMTDNILSVLCYQAQSGLPMDSYAFSPLRQMIHYHIRRGASGRRLYVYRLNKKQRGNSAPQHSHPAATFKMSNVRVPLPLLQAYRRLLVIHDGLSDDQANQMTHSQIAISALMAGFHDLNAPRAIADAYDMSSRGQNVLKTIQMARDGNKHRISMEDELQEETDRLNDLTKSFNNADTRSLKQYQSMIRMLYTILVGVINSVMRNNGNFQVIQPKNWNEETIAGVLNSSHNGNMSAFKGMLEAGKDIQHNAKTRNNNQIKRRSSHQR